MARENQKNRKIISIIHTSCDIITSGESRKLQQLFFSRQFCLRTQIDAERAGRRRSRTPFFYSFLLLFLFKQSTHKKKRSLTSSQTSFFLFVCVHHFCFPPPNRVQNFISNKITVGDCRQLNKSPVGKSKLLTRPHFLGLKLLFPELVRRRRAAV